MKKAAENKLASNAKLRSVNTKFWDDQYVIDLDPREKLLFLYFLTNPLTNLAGVYEISLKRIASDTDIDKDMVSKMIERFEEDKKILYRDGYIFLSNYQKNQNYNPKMVTNVENTLMSFPKSIRMIYENLIKNEEYSLYIPYRESESEDESEIKSEDEVEDSHLTPHDSHTSKDLPLFTDLTDYLPKDLDDDSELKNSIRTVIEKFTDINPDQATISQHFNLITKPLQCKRETAFKIFFEFFSNYKSLPSNQQNFRYANNTVKGKINDYEINSREQNSAKSKTDTQKVLRDISIDKNNPITQAASTVAETWNPSKAQDFQDIKKKLPPPSEKFKKEYMKGGLVN